MSIVRMKNDKGVDCDVDISNLDIQTTTGSTLTKGKSDALAKFMSAGSLDSLGQNEKDELKDVVARIGAGQIPELSAAVLVRFDVRWVSIN